MPFQWKSPIYPLCLQSNAIVRQRSGYSKSFRMVSLSAGALTVRYSKTGDRLSHTIGIVDGDSYLPWLESIEGSPDEPWPVSPPMQQMVSESFAPGASPVLLGVGLSGNGHWSTAIETKHSRLLKFDIACKNSKSSDWLGSEYRLLSPAQSGIRPDTIAFLLETGEHVANGKSSARIEMGVTIGLLELYSDEHRVRVRPKSDPASIQTHRWCYEITLFDAG